MTEILDSVKFRSADQRSVESIGPAVIAAAEQLAGAATFGRRPGTVMANVVETTQFFLGPAH